MKFTENEILEQLDLAFNDKPSSYFPTGEIDDIKYNFFLDLEHGYCETAGNKIHLYADETRWAIVFEKSGFQNRGNSAEIELDYIGNCIDYPIDKYPEQNYISNANNIILIEPEEFERIENKDGAEMETFELIGKETKEIKIRNEKVQFESDYRKYEKVGIEIRKDENPKRLIGFGNLIRYINETNPKIISATEEEIKLHIPKDLKKIYVLDKFHYSSKYDKKNLPSSLETYILISKILVTKDTTIWKPTLQPNNHWKNWNSGNL
jgi:hypothetical protein